MRNFLLVLLLLNILAFLYQRWILAPEVRVDAFHLAQEYPGLTMIEKAVLPELPSASDQLPGSTLAASTGDSDEIRCVRIGPFSREADAASVQSSLEKRSAEASRTTEQGQVWMGHWVQVINQRDRAAADQVRDALVAEGIADAYVLPGEDDNRISLGVFRLRSSANQVMDQAIGLGYEARVDDRYQPGVNFWLEAKIPGGSSWQLGEFRQDSGQILRTESISCDSVG